MGDSKFCYRCMEQYDASLHVCPACGFVESDAHDPMYVPPGTILHGKYLCGILLEYNGEGATYIGSPHKRICPYNTLHPRKEQTYYQCKLQ